MIPRELSGKNVTLPTTNTHSIVLITGSDLRHQRFAYRIHEEFGDLVLAWYQYEPPSQFVHGNTMKEKIVHICQKVKKRFFSDYSREEIDHYVKNKGFVRSIKKALSMGWFLLSTVIISSYLLLKRRKELARHEKKLFQREVEDLKQQGKFSPIIVGDPHSKEFIESIKKLDPYFFLSLGGPLYKKELLESIRGIAINQHAGWSPTFKGSNTIDWALYYRNLDCVGSTVHITTPDADAGSILRRSYPCLMHNDSPAMCFGRVVALGTELMIEVVKDIMTKKEITVYEQSAAQGTTYRNDQLGQNILWAIYKDFSNQWLKKELTRIRNF